MDALLGLKKKIRRASARVVFPEGENDRIILAASRIVQEEIARPILLGRADVIRKLAVGIVPSLEGIGHRGHVVILEIGRIRSSIQ